MKIILVKDVAHVGQADTLKEVADGFARNYLIPQGLAVYAAPGKVKELEAKQARMAIAKEALLRSAAETAKKLQGFVLNLSSKAEKETLFGSFGPAELSAALKDAGFAVPAETIKLVRPIKTVGEHAVKVEFSGAVTTQFVARVAASGEQATEGAAAKKKTAKKKAAARKPVKKTKKAA